MKRSCSEEGTNRGDGQREKRSNFSAPIDSTTVERGSLSKSNDADNNAAEQRNNEREVNNSNSKVGIDFNEINNLESDSQSSYLVIDSSNVCTDSESTGDELTNEVIQINQNEGNEFSTLTTTLRHFKSLPVFVVDYHDLVLEFIFRCIGSRHLPVEGSMLIHFDSHPDMVISNDIPAKATFDKKFMLEESSIESWIMPLCYTGIISRIVWVKNSWCTQIPNGKHVFNIGEHKERLAVDLALPYFLAEGNYCDTKELSNARNIELFVMNADELDAAGDPLHYPEIIDFFERKDKEVPYILDIDLDFFSVNNPFLSLYEKSHCYEQLQQIFALESNEMEQNTPASINDRRIRKLDALQNVFHYLDTHSSLKDYDWPTDIQLPFDLLQKLIDSLNANYKTEKIQWTLIYTAGCTADSGGLPHKIATSEELTQQYERFKRFIRKLPYLPVGVTIARSAEDNYCPKDQVDDIQGDIMKCLDLEWGSQLSQRVVNAYLDEEYDIMKL